MPLTEALVMPLTVVVSLATHNLAYGVLAGLLYSALLYVWQAAQIRITSAQHLEIKTYYLSGHLFFGSATALLERFDPRRDPAEVVIDFSQADLLDHAAAQILAKLIASYERRQKRVTLIGLSPQSCKVAVRAGLPVERMAPEC